MAYTDDTRVRTVEEPPPEPGSMTRQERRTAYEDAFDQNLSGSLPDYVVDLMTPKQKRRMARRTTKGLAKGVANMNILRDAYDTYGRPENDLREYYLNLLGGPSDVDSMRGLVDYDAGRFDVSPTRITNAPAPGERPELGETDLRGGTQIGERPGLMREGVDYQKGGRGYFGGLEEYARGVLADPTADFQRSAMLGKLSAYAQERLGSGLTEDEHKALMNPQLEAVEGQYTEGRRTLGNQVAASGQDPRMQAALMGSLERGRQQERAGIGRDMVLRELQRKQEMEQLGLGVAGQEIDEEALRQQRIATAERLGFDVGQLGEQVRQFDVGTAEDARRFDVSTLEGMREFEDALREQGRQYDVGTLEGARQFDVGTLEDMRRFDWDAIQREIARRDALMEEGRQFDYDLGQRGREFDVSTMEGARQFDVQNQLARQDAIERYLMGLAQMGEGRRQYDLGFVDSRRQARLNRDLLRKLASEAKPTDLEKTGAILGGIRGGLFGGTQ